MLILKQEGGEGESPTNMSLGAAKHDPLHEAAQREAAFWVFPFKRAMQQAPPDIAVIEGLIGQELQQALCHTTLCWQ